VKKLLVLIGIIGSLYADQNHDSAHVVKENVQIAQDLGAEDKQYSFQQDEYEDYLDEYEDYLSDNVQPPALSSVQIFIAEIFGYLYWQFIVLQHMTYSYASDIKQRVNQWYTAVVQKYQQLSHNQKKTS